MQRFVLSTLAYGIALCFLTSCTSLEGKLTENAIRSALESGKDLEYLDGKMVILEVPVFIPGMGVGIADLRTPIRLEQLEDSELEFDKDCVDLVLHGQDEEVTTHSRIARIVGKVEVLGSIANDVVVSIKSDGVKFAPRCGYFGSEYFFVSVSDLDFIDP